jgi:hypothetical protein
VLYYYKALQILFKRLSNKHDPFLTTKKGESKTRKYKKNHFKIEYQHIFIDNKLEYVSLENDYMDHNKQVSTFPHYLYNVLTLQAKSNYKDSDLYSIDSNELKDLEFLNQNEYFYELGLAFLYGRSGLQISYKKSIFYLILSTQYGNLNAQFCLAKVYLSLEKWDLAKICFLTLKSKHPFLAYFGLELIKSFKKKYLNKHEFMNLLFLTRTAAINKSDLAIFYYTYFFTIMKGLWIGEIPQTVLKSLEECTKKGDPSCGYMLGKTIFCFN